MSCSLSRYSVPGRNRLSADEPDLERTLDAMTVGGRDRSAALRIDLRQPPMQTRLSPRIGCNAAEPRAHGLIARRHLGQSGKQRAQIEKSSANQDRTRNFVDQRPRHTRVFGSVELLAGFENVIEMMRDAGALVFGWFCAADIESSIELDRVEVDNLAACRPREAKGEIGFSDAGRSGDDDCRHSCRAIGACASCACARPHVAERAANARGNRSRLREPASCKRRSGAW